jgi:hypothetical protein
MPGQSRSAAEFEPEELEQFDEDIDPPTMWCASIPFLS